MAPAVSPWKGYVMTKKRIAAIAALIFIGLLYLASLVLAFIDSPFARSCLMAALFCTIVVPAAVYGYVMLLERMRGDKPQEDKQKEEETF